MSSNELQRYNESRKSKRKSSSFNSNPKEKKSSSKKVSFFNPIVNPQKNNSNNQFLVESKIVNDDDTDDFNSNLSDNSYDEDREKQLEIVNEKFQNLFLSKEKLYSNIIKEINAEKKLFFKKSVMSFNLLVLKIKCLIKLLKSKFQESLTTKDYFQVDLYIQKIKKDFKNLTIFIDEDSKYEYEIITQVYAKFLYLMSIIYSKKEEYITSFSYISLGVNLLKVFFVRQHVSKNIETYQIYAKLVVMLINRLISDNNISQALVYINLLSRLSEIAFAIISKNKSSSRYENKFNKYQSFGFLYMGFCYELSPKVPNNYKIALKAYKEAYYFMSKSSNKMSIFAELSSVITIERKGIYLAQILFEKLAEKLTLEAMEKQKEFEHQERLKKKKIEEAKNEEKKYRLKLIASGVAPDNQNLVSIQNTIFNQILTPNNQVLIDKLDDELISYVYRDKRNKKKENEEKEKKEEKEKEGKAKYKLPSIDIMKNLCHYKMYNNLMTDDFKEFLLTNKNLKFNCPQKEKESLDKIQKYLNRKMEIGTEAKEKKENKVIIKEKENNKDNNEEDKNNNDNKDIKDNKEDKDKENTNLLLNVDTNMSYESNYIKNKLYKSIANIKKNNNNKTIKNNNLSDNNNININYNYNPNQRYQKENNKLSISYRNPKHSYILSKEKDIKDDKDNKDKENNLNQIYISFPTNPNNSFAAKNTQRTQKSAYKFLKKVRGKTAKGPEVIKVDKFVFNKKYYKQYSYFEKMINREFTFQKQFLDQKNHNAKMYFKEYDTELNNNGIIPREEIYKSFLILNDKVTSKERNYEKELKIEIEFKNKPRILGNMFKSVSNKMKEGKQIKNAMGKVIGKYLSEQKLKKVHKKFLDNKNINRKNEVYIMNLNDNIKQINYLLVSKNNEIKKNKKKALYHQNNTHEV